MTHVTYVGNFLSSHGLNPTYSEALVPELSAQGLNVRRASRYRNPILRFLDMAVAVLHTPRRRACVIVDLCSGPRAFPAAYLITVICRRIGRPYIVVLHGGTLPEVMTKSPKRLLAILTGAERVISPSAYLAESFCDHVNVEVIPNALDVRKYRYRERLRPRPNFLYLRAFHRLYGAITAVKAFAIVQQSYPEAKLRMAGPEEDDSLEECKSIVKELGLESRVEFLGRVPKSRIPEIGDASDIFLNPTFVDNTPVSNVEAMAMGLCIVATTAGGLPYLLKDGETALLVPPGDERQMAAAMLRVLETPELASRLSRSARALAEEMDWSEVTPRWIDLIRSVVRQQS